MKRRVLALALAAVLCLSTSMTAFAASSTTNSNSSSQESSGSSAPAAPTASAPQSVEKVVANTAAGAAIKPEVVRVAIATPSGTVAAVTLDKVIDQKAAEVVATVTNVAATAAKTQIATLLTADASPMFTQTVEALAQIKGADVVVNNCGTIKTKATAKDALGNVIASAGKIKNVTSSSLIMLMSINADGTIEYVEGVVDPVTGAVMGAFKGTPSVITVLVLA